MMCSAAETHFTHPILRAGHALCLFGSLLVPAPKRMPTSAWFPLPQPPPKFIVFQGSEHALGWKLGYRVPGFLQANPITQKSTERKAPKCLSAGSFFTCQICILARAVVRSDNIQVSYHLFHSMAYSTNTHSAHSARPSSHIYTNSDGRVPILVVTGSPTRQFRWLAFSLRDTHRSVFLWHGMGEILPSLPNTWFLTFLHDLIPQPRTLFNMFHCIFTLFVWASLFGMRDVQPTCNH